MIGTMDMVRTNVIHTTICLAVAAPFTDAVNSQSALWNSCHRFAKKGTSRNLLKTDHVRRHSNRNQPKIQKVNFTDNCACRGSPTPCRKKPSKLNKPGVLSGLILFLLLKVLNNSKTGINA